VAISLKLSPNFTNARCKIACSRRVHSSIFLAFIGVVVKNEGVEMAGVGDGEVVERGVMKIEDKDDEGKTLGTVARGVPVAAVVCRDGEMVDGEPFEESALDPKLSE
jgi:hypothetical protein